MIAVKEEDRDALRFLWVDDVSSAETKFAEYRYSRVVFGVTSSPFPVLKHITSYEGEYTEFVNQILRSLYVR